MNLNQDKSKRVAIFIDGSNFYFKLKDLNIPNLTYFNYGNFSLWISQDRKIVSKKYYVGCVKAKENDKKAKKMRENQLNLFNNLSSKKNGFYVEKGYIMKNDNSFHEKGVDVKIAVDILVGAYEDLFDAVLLISSDTDLIPVIKKVISLGKEVEYIGFSHRPSFGLIRNASSTRLLTKIEVENFQKI